jgi:HPt (histidine-containing phosphotransfer) domain-containing protein
MASPKSVSPGDPSLLPAAARETLSDLRESLLRIAHLHGDGELRLPIAESIMRCNGLAALFDQVFATPPDPEMNVDQQVFERLMLLAGPSTALELLEQMLKDLSAVSAAFAAADPLANGPVLRSQCHILIAVAGAIGATPLQKNAEQLQAAERAQDTDAIPGLSRTLMARLQSVISFVHAQRQQRVNA